MMTIKRSGFIAIVKKIEINSPPGRGWGGFFNFNVHYTPLHPSREGKVGMIMVKKVKSQLSKVNCQHGFSIIEVIAAVGILTIGLVGVSSLMFQNIQVQQVNYNNLIASMLAQEGLELVRNIRDKNWLAESVWNVGFAAPNATTTFAINFDGSTSTAANINDSGAVLCMDYTDGFYVATTTSGCSGIGAPTQFSRLITVKDFPASSSTIVSSLVRWKKGSQNYDYVAETVLYDWR